MRSFPGNPLILSLLVAVTLAGCGPRTDPSEAVEGPKTFIFARGADAQKLDPADVDDGESVNSMAHVLEGLLRFRPGTFEVEPHLAERYTVSPDGRIYTFFLRAGVQFHDGTPLNAESARFSFDRQMDPAHPAHFPGASFQYWNNLFADVERLETVDEMTLRFHLSRPNAAQLSAFASFPAWLVSPAAFERFGDRLTFHPVGTGPYRFSDWRPNEAIIYESNKNYWGIPEPGFERMVLRSIPLNSSRLSELLAGRIHGLDGIQPSELSDLKKDDRFRILSAPGMNVGYLAFSHLSERMNDPSLRRAIAMAIDRESIVRLALDNYGRVAGYPAPEGFPGIPADAGPIRHDPEAARALVAAHPEWRDKPLILSSFGEPRMYFPDPQRIASIIRNDLESVGLRVDIVNREFKSHLHLTRSGDFELALLGWIADMPDTDNFLSTFFHSRAAVPGSATNISFYRNPEMDQLLESALMITDPEQREALYARALDLWARDLPLVPLVQADQITVLVRDIAGYDLSPIGNHFFGPVFWQKAEDTLIDDEG